MEICLRTRLRGFNNLIMHVYIVPEPGNSVLRRCTILLSLTRTCFHPAHISTPKRAYNACCHYRRKALLKHIATASCQVLIFMDVRVCVCSCPVDIRIHIHARSWSRASHFRVIFSSLEGSRLSVLTWIPQFKWLNQTHYILKTL